MDKYLYMGLDPGASGGVALLSAEGVVVTTLKAPETDRDLFDFMAYFADRVRMGALELVHSSPQMGVASAFTFGNNYGALRMSLIAAGVPFETVTPQKWQKALSCMSKGDKNVTKRKAQELFPGIKVTHNIADALLIAEWCRREHRALPTPRAGKE